MKASARITLKLTIISLAQPRIPPMIANRITYIQKTTARLIIVSSPFPCQAQGFDGQSLQRPEGETGVAWRTSWKPVSEVGLGFPSRLAGADRKVDHLRVRRQPHAVPDNRH